MDGLSASDVAMLNNDNGMGGMNGAFWIFALLILANGGIGGWGNNNGNSNAIQADVNRGFDNQNLQAQTRDILAAVTNGTAQTIAASTQNASNAITAIKDGNASLIIYRKEETMMDASQVVMIVIALIGVVGSVLTNVILNGKAQAVTETKLENLISEVKKHNDFAVKIPAMEVELSNLKETVKDLKAKIK